MHNPSEEFSKNTLDKIDQLRLRYPNEHPKSMLIPVLHMAQAELGGWLSKNTMDYVATLLNLNPIEVYEVATFYSMFHLAPSGKYVIEVCRTGTCAMLGADAIIAYLQSKLGVNLNTVTPDGLFMIKEVECLASCGTAPMMQIGERYFENLTTESVDAVIDALIKGNRLDVEPIPAHSILCRTMTKES